VGAAAAAAASSTRGGWGRAAAAALAVAFGWAAISKLASMHRWRRTLDEHRLPRWLAAPAAGAIPLVEALVPLLVILGRERAAAVVALAALAAFSAALVRTAMRDGRRVPCGCFGRTVIDVRVALVRNAVLTGVALFAWVGATPDPKVILPSGTDVVPAMIAGVTLVVAAATAWRASVWFSRGRA
jgi:Methylamine utilisation protein MauE